MLARRDTQIKKEEQRVQKDVYTSTMKNTKGPFLQMGLDQSEDQDEKTSFDLSFAFLKTRTPVDHEPKYKMYDYTEEELFGSRIEYRVLRFDTRR